MSMSTIRIDDQHQCNNPSHGITCMAVMTACMGAMQAHKYNSTALMMQMSLGMEAEEHVGHSIHLVEVCVHSQLAGMRSGYVYEGMQRHTIRKMQGVQNNWLWND